MRLIPLAAIFLLLLLSACGRGPTNVYKSYYQPLEPVQTPLNQPTLAEQNQASLQNLGNPAYTESLPDDVSSDSEEDDE